MRIFLSVILLAHGLAHLVGFIVPWKLADLEGQTYKTTLLGDRVDVGDVGIRIVGLLWLIGALAFMIAGGAGLSSQSWWLSLTFYSALFSLILSIFGWPEAQVGTWVNMIILGILIGKYSVS